MSIDILSLRKQLQIDCEECCGLCCVGLFFSKLDGFPQDKPAGQPCMYLRQDFLCDVHSELSERHLKGCLAFDCFGAGQRTTKLYAPKTWTSEASHQELFETFTKVMRIHQMVWYLTDALMIDEAKRMHPQIELWITTLMNIHDMKQLHDLDLDTLQDHINQVLKQIIMSLTKGKANHHQYMGHGFHGRSLDYHDFSMKNAIKANFQKCSLKSVCFLGTDLRDVDVRGCDLTKTYFLTQGQINSMHGNLKTKIPKHLQYPSTWNI